MSRVSSLVFPCFLSCLVLSQATVALAADGETWRSWFGVDVGGAAVMDGRGVAGDAPAYLDEMGAAVTDSTDGFTSITAGLSQGYRFLPWLCIEVSERFFWTGLDAEFTMNRDMDYSMRRFIIPIGVMARVNLPSETSYASLGIGPTAVVIHTRETGYFGDTSSWDLRPGFSGSATYYFDVASHIMLGFEVVYSYIPLPKVNPMFRDGESIESMSILFGLRYKR